MTMNVLLSCRVMIGKSTNRYLAMQYLITAGVPISALRLGQEHYTVTGHCNGRMFHHILVYLNESHGPEYVEEHRDLLFGLWADVILHPFEPCPELLMTWEDTLNNIPKLFTVMGSYTTKQRGRGGEHTLWCPLQSTTSWVLDSRKVLKPSAMPFNCNPG